MKTVTDKSIVIETDLTEEEKSVIKKEMAGYENNPDSYISLEAFNISNRI